MFGLVGRFRVNSEKEIPNDKALRSDVILVDVPGGRIRMKTLNMKLSDELYEALKEAAREHGLPMAELVRIALRKYVLSNSSEEDVLTLKDLSRAVSDLRSHLRRLEEENAELRSLLGRGQSRSPRRPPSAGVSYSGRDYKPLSPDSSSRSSQSPSLPPSVSTFGGGSDVGSISRDRRDVMGGVGDSLGFSGRGERSVHQGSKRRTKSGAGIYEELALEVMQQAPSREWGIKELFEEVMRGRGKILEEQGVVLNPDSFKDRVIRMSKKGVIRKVGRGKYTLA